MHVWTDGFISVPPGAGYRPGLGQTSPPDAPTNGGDIPIERGAPPSSYAVAAFVNGEKGSFARLVGVTVIRAIFIWPGLMGVGYLVMPKDNRLGVWRSVALALGASTSISTGLVIWYRLKKSMSA